MLKLKLVHHPSVCLSNDGSYLQKNTGQELEGLVKFHPVWGWQSDRLYQKPFRPHPAVMIISLLGHLS